MNPQHPVKVKLVSKMGIRVNRGKLFVIGVTAVYNIFNMSFFPYKSAGKGGFLFLQLFLTVVFQNQNRTDWSVERAGH